jgi:hypothetical protein
MASFDGGERCNARGGARGHSPELSLELAPVARSLQGLHLHDLRRMGALTNVFAGVDEVGRGLGMRKRTQREMARLGVLVVLLWLRFLSRRWWRLLFLNDQSGGAEALRSKAAASGWGMNFLRWGKGWGGQRGPIYRAWTGTVTRGGSSRPSSSTESMV